MPLIVELPPTTTSPLELPSTLAPSMNTSGLVVYPGCVVPLMNVGLVICGSGVFGVIPYVKTAGTPNTRQNPSPLDCAFCDQVVRSESSQVYVPSSTVGLSVGTVACQLARTPSVPAVAVACQLPTVAPSMSLIETSPAGEAPFPPFQW